MAVYIVLDADGAELNRIEWDGSATYDVEAAYGEGARLERDEGPAAMDDHSD